MTDPNNNPGPSVEKSGDLHHATAAKRIKELDTLDAIRDFLSSDEERPVVKAAVDERIREIMSEHQRHKDAADAKQAANPQTMIDDAIKVVDAEGWKGFDDFNEGEEWGPEKLPPELPPFIVLDGRKVPVTYVRLDPEWAPKHELAHKMQPVMYDTGHVRMKDYGVPRHYFNGAGELRMGDTMTFMVASQVWDNWQKSRLRPYESQIKTLAREKKSKNPGHGGLNLDGVQHQRVPTPASMLGQDEG